jgi:tRNA pseudouridine38-40 synthase
VVHFETDAVREESAWVVGTNKGLPQVRRVGWAEHVNEGFHARYSALWRRYQYFLHCGPVRSAIFNQQLSWECRELDAEKMALAAQLLLGKHDFSAFRAAGCQASTPIREITDIQLTRHNRVVKLEVEANAFLYHMVRNIVGTLMAVGKGEQSIDWVADVLASRQREFAGITAPPGGLYLSGVGYPDEYGLPRFPLAPFTL